MSDLDFGDLTIQEIKVPIGGKNYILREGSGEAVIRYKAKLGECLIYQDGKPVGLRSTAEAEAILVAGCLFDEQGRQAGLEKIKSFPNRVVNALFRKAEDITELGGTNPMRVLLEKALSQNGSPIEFDALRQWIHALPGDDFNTLKAWIRSEDSAKNEPSDTTVGSD